MDPSSTAEATTVQSPTRANNNRRAAISQQIWLVRHGETEWSLSGRHTGTTDLPLTPRGELQAREVGSFLASRTFATVITSPLRRAMDTCRRAGFGDVAQTETNLLEWDYGDYEGRTTAEIQSRRPSWSLWKDGVPGGESLLQVAARAQAAIDRALQSPGDVLLFAHGHILRVLCCCWLGLAPEMARLFAIDTAAVTTLGYEHSERVLTRLNGRAELPG